MVEGKINGQEISVVLDSGACISIVPESLVHSQQNWGSPASLHCAQL